MFSPLEDYRKLSSMDREILFRGKRIDNGEWVEGNFCAVEKLDCSGDEYFIIEHAANGGHAMHRMIIDIADAPTDDLLGLKEAISMVVEGAGRVVRVDVQEVVLEQLRMEI